MDLQRRAMRGGVTVSRQSPPAIESDPSAGADAPPPEESDPRTPIWISRRVQIALVVAAIALLAWAVWFVPDILTIVLSAAALALILSYPVRQLARVLPRGLAVLAALLAILAAIVLALVVLIPLLIDQLTDLIQAWPSIQTDLDQLLDRAVAALEERGMLPGESADLADQIREDVSAQTQQVAADLLRGLLNVATGAFGMAVRLIAVVIVAIYFLLDVGKLRDSFIALAPSRYYHDAEALWDAFGDSISRYLGGVILIAIITGAASGIALWMIGVPYAILLGVWVAFTSLIPVFGTYIGVVPAIPLALAESPTTAALTILVYVIIQNVQDNVLTPRIQGESARVHPIIVLLTVLWVGLAFGLVWSVLAVPALVITRVLFDFFRVRLRVRPEPRDAVP
jgi:predicted PurR-regulated permease PerM